jgi:hypothetical protein
MVSASPRKQKIRHALDASTHGVPSEAIAESSANEILNGERARDGRGSRPPFAYFKNDRSRRELCARDRYSLSGSTPIRTGILLGSTERRVRPTYPEITPRCARIKRLSVIPWLTHGRKMDHPGFGGIEPFTPRPGNTRNTRCAGRRLRGARGAARAWDSAGGTHKRRAPVTW